MMELFLNHDLGAFSSQIHLREAGRAEDQGKKKLPSRPGASFRLKALLPGHPALAWQWLPSDKNNDVFSNVYEEIAIC